MVSEMIQELHNRGANIVKIIDISSLSEQERREYNTAIIIGIALNPKYIPEKLGENNINHQEYGKTEHHAGELADWLADFITSKGYKAYAQSDKNLIHGLFDETTKTSILPHKKIAVMSGMGWIGKSNLLVTPQYGSALCICTVLTNAPLPMEDGQRIIPSCGECMICKEICPTNAIHGTTWEEGMSRDLIIDVHKCICCLKCLIYCPWTQKYRNKNTARV